MGFLNSLFSNSDNIMNKALGDLANDYKKEGLDFKCMIPTTKVFGLDIPYENVNYFMPFSDRIRFTDRSKQDLLSGKWIMRKDIKSIKIMNDVQIEEQSNLGKIMIFGILALGMKKNTKEINNRSIVFMIEEDGVEFSVVIKLADYLEDKGLEITKKLNKWTKTGEFERVI